MLFRSSRPVSGRLKIVTGYGAETSVIEISLIPPEKTAEKAPVEVDARLSKPQPRSREQPPQRTETAVPARSIAAGAIVLLSLSFVVIGALIVGNLGAILGAGIVLLGVAGAAALVYSS